MKFSELITEGMYVVKSKDGVEKRFRDASSQEAEAWRASTQKKPPKVAAYSNAYWEKKYHAARADGDFNFVAPITRISEDDADAINQVVERQFGTKNIDWTLSSHGTVDIGNTTCATRQIRVTFEYGPEDDMGVSEPTSDTQYIKVGRNPKKPKQIDFLGFA